MRTETKQTTTIEILERGWRALTQELGPAQASIFLQSFPRGENDSVAFWKNFWGGKTVDEIHHEILQAKKNKEI